MRKSKILGVVLAMVLILSPVAWAATTAGTAFSDVTAGTRTSANFAILNVLDIFRGYGDGRVGPDDMLTREQFCTIVVRMLGKTKVANALVTVPTTFSDDASIATWARGAVVYAFNQGIINGYPDHTFQPQGNVTGVEAYAMLLRALNLDTAARGDWPANYVLLANDTGFDANVDEQPTNVITRSAMAQMVVNALNAAFEVDSTGALLEPGDPGYTGTEALIEQYAVRGTVDAAADSTITIDGGPHDLADTVYLHGGVTLDDFVGLEVTAVLNADGQVAYVGAGGETGVVTGLFDQLDTNATGDSIIVFDDSTEVVYNSGTTFVVDGNSSSAGALHADDILKVNLQDGVAARVEALRWSSPNAVVLSITDNTDGTRTLAVDINGDNGADKTYTVTDSSLVRINGSPATAADLEEEDVADIAGVAVSGSTVYRIDVTRKIRSGIVDRMTMHHTVSESYTSVRLTNGMTLRLDALFDGDVPVADDHVRYALNSDGYVRHDLGFENFVAIVKVAAYAVDGTTQEVTVDYRGVSMTYEEDTALIDDGDVGKLVEITVSGTTGKLIAVATRTINYATEWEVVGLDTEANSVIIRTGSTMRYIDNPPVYAEQATGTDVGDYIGLSGLAIGDTIYVDPGLTVVISSNDN